MRANMEHNESELDKKLKPKKVALEKKLESYNNLINLFIFNHKKVIKGKKEGFEDDLNRIYLEILMILRKLKRRSLTKIYTQVLELKN